MTKGTNMTKRTLLLLLSGISTLSANGIAERMAARGVVTPEPAVAPTPAPATPVAASSEMPPAVEVTTPASTPASAASIAAPAAPLISADTFQKNTEAMVRGYKERIEGRISRLEKVSGEAAQKRIEALRAKVTEFEARIKQSIDAMPAATSTQAAELTQAGQQTIMDMIGDVQARLDQLELSLTSNAGSIKTLSGRTAKAVKEIKTTIKSQDKKLKQLNEDGYYDDDDEELHDPDDESEIEEEYDDDDEYDEEEEYSDEDDYEDEYEAENDYGYEEDEEEDDEEEEDVDEMTVEEAAERKRRQKEKELNDAVESTKASVTNAKNEAKKSLVRGFLSL